MENIFEEPIEQRSEEACSHGLRSGSEFMSVDDHQRPSTSRQSNLRIEGCSPTKTLKRGPSIGSDLNENTKRARLASNNTLQREGNGEESTRTYPAAGLKKSMHGNIYQLKYLMLILYRAWKREHPFRLATEMIAAEKFDDVVLDYQDTAGNKVHSFVQVKHKQDCNETISASDLLADDVPGAPFSILKYFKSWRKIKKHEDFSERELKHFILCTNIGLNANSLNEEKIEISDYVGVKDTGSESKSKERKFDEFLIVMDKEEPTPLHNLEVVEESKLHHKLKSASDVNLLARVLAQRVYEGEKIDRNTAIFKDYDAALAKEVIDAGVNNARSGKLFPEFVRNNGLSNEAEKFRTIFLRNIKAFQSADKSYTSDEDIMDSLEMKVLKISEKFGGKPQLATGPESTYRKLPDDDVSNQEISDFLKEFVLAVKQPNEVALGEIIEHEIGDEYNLQDGAFVADALLKYMLDWFKEKSGEFLVNKSADDFFKEMKCKISSFNAMGVSWKYMEKFHECGIKFEHESTEVRNFVNSSDSTTEQILEFINRSQTFLTALRVYQTLMQIPKFKRDDSFIFITLKSLLLPKIKKGVLLAFKSPLNHDLLVVNCKSISAKQCRNNLWNSLDDILTEKTNKKIILIIQGDDDSAIEFENSYKLLPENNDNYDINSLEKSSQRELLERNIVRFQGKEESFGRLFGAHDGNNIECKKLTDLGQMMDAKILVQLIKNEVIRIGDRITGLSEILSSYYIPRKIVRHVVIKVDILKASGKKDLYAIGGVDRAALTKFVKNEKILRSFDDSSRIDSQQRVCFVLDHNREKGQFEVLCQRNVDRKIHWLQGVSGKLIWIQSRGDVSNLVEYKDTNQGDLDDKKNEETDDKDGLGATYLEEDDLVDFDEQQRIVILSDVAGMGKTTILTYLEQEIKDKQPSSLIIAINLNQRTNVLDKEKAVRTYGSNNTDGAVDFLVDKLARLDTDLERQVYKTILKGAGEAALLFDGFDEISPTYGHIVIELLQALVRLPIKKIIVTTRPHTSKALEKELGTFSYSLQPFSPENQMDFLKKFWKQGLSGNYSDQTLEKRLELHAKRVIELLDKSVDRKMMDFTGVPLQTMMVADLYRYRSTAEGDTSDQTNELTDLEDDEAKLPEKIDIIDLYGKFVHEKFEIRFTQKQYGDSTNLAAREAHEDHCSQSLMEHEKFALVELFENEIVSILLPTQHEVKHSDEDFRRKNMAAERTGLVTPDSEGKPHFIHRTFAEYFAATFLIKILTDDNRNQEVRNFLLAELFVKPQYRTIRAFLNCLLLTETYVVENQSWKLDLGKHRDESGQTVYHVAAAESNFEIVKFFLNRLGGHCKSDSGKPDTGINLRDYGSFVTALAIVIHRGYDLNVVKLLVESGADIHWKNSSTGETLLHAAVAKPDNLAVVEYLCDKGADVNKQNHRDRTPLHYAVHRNLDVVKYLCSVHRKKKTLSTSAIATAPLRSRQSERKDGGCSLGERSIVEKVEGLNARDKKGNTPLHDAAAKADGEGASVNYDRNANAGTPLHTATEKTNYYDVVEHLGDQGADVNCRNNDGATPLHLAVLTTDLKIVKYLREKGADPNCPNELGETPLHLAVAIRNNFEVVKYLCNNGADINREGQDGRTPLHYAAGDATDNLKIVKYLCDKGANPDCQNENEETPLHLAVVRANNFKVVKYLCDKSANLNYPNVLNKTPLYLAVDRANNLKMVKYLCSKGAKPNCQNENGGTPLHSAVFRANNFKMVKYLCEQGASPNCKDYRKRTPLHGAVVRTDNLEVVEYLCDKLCDKAADINCQDRDGETPLHRATGYATGNLKIVKYLCDQGANPNCQNGNGETPLHLAVVRPYNLEVVKYLCDKINDINCRAIGDRTPLHCAAANAASDLEIIEYLCDKGANINCRNTNGDNPLDAAVRTHNNLAMVEYLRSRVAGIHL